ncbi:MAG: S-methyl-5-thioribose-1-phosphate isomerase [Deltaproteobacteria bacterium]
MLVNGTHYRTIWLHPDDDRIVQIIDQRQLPHRFVVEDLRSVEDFVAAIKQMHVRGAGLIGATAGFGMYCAALNAPDHCFENSIKTAADKLVATRPTATNLAWAVDRQLTAMASVVSLAQKRQIALRTACAIADEDADFCRRIGENGVSLMEEISRQKNGETVNILTHCNAGWLAFVDYGSATAPIYEAQRRGIDVHVWVDETRPWLQGAKLTAWELGQQGVKHTLIADNTGGHLMQHGMVDMVIVGTDRTTYTGDAANKIGTYLKALAAKDNGVPFYVALPSSTFDWTIRDGVNEIPIEQRGADEMKYVRGCTANDREETVLIAPLATPAANYGFDVTPARLITGLITERGVMAANEEAIGQYYPEKQRNA